MSKPDLLIDQVYRSCFSKKHPQPALRAALESARRFVLDDTMAAFLADLTYQSFQGRFEHIKPHRRIQHIHAGIDSIRHFARLPHKTTWVEFSNAATLRRQDEIGLAIGRTILAGLAEGAASEPAAAERQGWLLRQHDQIDTAFSAMIWFYNAEGVFTAPIGIMWDTGDGPLPWRPLPSADIEVTASELVVRCRGYVRDNIGFRSFAEFGLPSFAENPEWVRKGQGLLHGLVQHVWAFLSTVNKIPIIGQHKVACARGFVARGGRYRRFLDHHVITLQVPEKADTRKLAQRALTELRRLRAHQVRGHFRDDWHKPKGNKSIWIAEHQRGDASLGFVLHDYAVKHDDEAAASPDPVAVADLPPSARRAAP